MTEKAFSDDDLAAIIADERAWYGATAFAAIASELLESRKALAECGEKLAHRDKKIAELRELIHAGAMPAGATSAKQSAKRPPRR